MERATYILVAFVTFYTSQAAHSIPVSIHLYMWRRHSIANRGLLPVQRGRTVSTFRWSENRPAEEDALMQPPV